LKKSHGRVLNIPVYKVDLKRTLPSGCRYEKSLAPDLPFFFGRGKLFAGSYNGFDEFFSLPRGIYRFLSPRKRVDIALNPVGILRVDG
jgi:hypothetical protein